MTLTIPYSPVAFRSVLGAMLLIVVAVGAAVLLYVFSIGLLGALASSFGTGHHVQTVVLSQIYDTYDNIGFLNEQANFTIRVWNPLYTRILATVKVTAGGSVLQNATFWAEPNQITTMNITKKLSMTGGWTVLVMVEGGPEGPVTDSYSFEVKTNQDDANLAVNQLRDSRLHTDLEIGTLVVAVVALGASCFSIYIQYHPRVSKRRRK